MVNDEYGDYSDPEGSSDGGWRGFNAPHKDQLGIHDGYGEATGTLKGWAFFDVRWHRPLLVRNI